MLLSGKAEALKLLLTEGLIIISLLSGAESKQRVREIYSRVAYANFDRAVDLIGDNKSIMVLVGFWEDIAKTGHV